MCGGDQLGPPAPDGTGLQLVHPLRQLSDRPQLEQVPDGQLDAAGRPDRGDQLRRHQRVATQLEEGVVGTDCGVPEQRRKQLGYLPFVAGDRLAVPGGRNDLRCRQSGPVDLSVRGDRDLVEDDVGGRRHVIGQRRGHSRADTVDVDGGGVRRCQVGDQTFTQLRKVRGDHDGLPDTGIDGDRRGHLAEFDAEARGS